MNQEYIPSHPHNWLLEIGAETGLVGFGLICHLSTYGSQNVRGFRYSSKCCGLGGDGIVRGVLGELACELFHMVSMVVGGLCRAPQFAIGNDGGGKQENRRQRNVPRVEAEQSAS